MSMYYGWNREEMERVGAAAKHNEDQKHADSVFPGFNPINIDRAPVEFISPSRTLLALDSDALCDLPLEDFPQLPFKAKKRGSVSKQTGRAVSIGGVWEYMDEGDMTGQNRSIDPEEERRLKRRKSVPGKRSKSIRLPSKPLKPIWENDEAAKLDDEANSQLTTPIETNKKTKKTVNSSKPRGKGTKMGPFKNSLITKVSSTSMKGDPDLSPKLSQRGIHHQRWLTTQEVVNSSSNGTAKTTLDKLAAFRYTASSADSSSRHLTISQRQDQDLRHDGFIHQSETVQKAQYEDSSYGIIPSDDSIFDGGYIVHQPLLQQDNMSENDNVLLQLSRIQSGFDMLCGGSNLVDDTLRYKEQASNLVEDYPFHQAEELIISQPNATLLSNDMMQGEGFEPFSKLPPVSVAAPIDVPKEAPSYGKPLANHPHTDESLPDSARTVAEDHLLFEDQPRHTAAQDKYLKNSYQPGARISKYRSIRNQYVDCQAFNVGEDIHELPRLPMSPTTSNNYIPRFLNQSIHIQVERSDIEDYDRTPRDISKDFEMDDFDEGLDDMDFLQLASDAVIPATQDVSKQIDRGLSETADENTLSENYHSVNGKPIEPTIASPATLCPSNEDEYPMDEEDEADMLQLPDPATGAMEAFQAVENRGLVACLESSNSAYDASLQYLPAKPQLALKHQSTEEHAGIDKNRENSVLVCANSMNPIKIEEQAEEDEDWSFIRINQAHESHVAVVPPGIAKPRNTTAALTRGLTYATTPKTHGKFDKTLEFSVSKPIIQFSPRTARQLFDDSHEYEPLKPFARPDFPPLALDRSPILGLSTQSFLRVCFRVGEMLKEGGRNDAQHQGAVIELFARVTFSSRIAGTKKQHFQFADLWHDRPPFPNGVLFNYKTTRLADSESKIFVGAVESTMARCIGRLKRDPTQGNGWLLHIINIRLTDWEEIKWTKRIVSAGRVKSETLKLKL